jgi:hypothetical protein
LHRYSDVPSAFLQGLPYVLKPSRTVCAFHYLSESMRMRGYNRAAGHVCMVQVISRAKRDADLHVSLVQCVRALSDNVNVKPIDP